MSARAWAVIAMAIALASCQPVPAIADGHLYTGAWSQHVGDDSGMHQTHDALGIEVDGWMLSYFVNSYDRKGAFGGYTYRRQWGDWEGSLLLGVAYAYRGCYRDSKDHITPCPLIVPGIAYTRYTLQPQVMLWANAVVLAVRWRLW